MNKIAPHLGWIVGVTLAVLPILLWLPHEPFSYYTESSVKIAGTIAKICSLTGTAMFAFSIILSARLKWVEWMFGGLDKLYKAHRFFGTYGFYLIMGHVLFLTLEYGQGFRGGLKELWLDPKLALQAGRIAFLVMALIIIVTVLMRVKHQTFIRVHRLLGLFFLLGAVHAFAVRAELAINPGLRIYMIALIGAATAAYLYHSIFGSLFIRRYRYVVTAINQLGSGLTEVVLKPLWRPIVFTPGQFAFVSLRDEDVDKESHPYSFSSSNRDSLVKFVVKNLGDYTANLSKVDVGSQAYLEGPFGSFSAQNYKKHDQVWIAGGIGITPFLSIARSFVKNPPHKIDLYYCTKVAEEAHYNPELQALGAKYNHFRLLAICESVDGFITTATIEKNSGSLKNKEVFICGPPVMMKNLQRQLESIGVPEQQVHFEEFSF